MSTFLRIKETHVVDKNFLFRFGGLLLPRLPAPVQISKLEIAPSAAQYNLVECSRHDDNPPDTLSIKMGELERIQKETTCCTGFLPRMAKLTFNGAGPTQLRVTITAEPSKVGNRNRGKEGGPPGKGDRVAADTLIHHLCRWRPSPYVLPTPPLPVPLLSSES